LKAGVIIQARMNSNRLPGKVMLPLEGKPVLWHVLNRVKHCKKVKRVILATSTEKEDRKLKKVADGLNVSVYFGSLNDVLSRYYNAAKKYKLDFIVRITADCPVIDPGVVDEVVERAVKGGYDYYGLAGKFPQGLDVTVYSYKALEIAYKEAKLPSEREHVAGAFLAQHKDRFKTGCYRKFKNRRYYRWTLDEPRDYEFLKIIFRELYKSRKIFNYKDIYRLLKRKPEIMKINAGIIRNEGYLKSLKEDEFFLKNKKIIFITEGGSKIGMGHLMRSIAVAECVRDKGLMPIFIVNKEKNVIETLKNYNFHFQTVSSIVQCGLNIKGKRVLIDSKKNVSATIRKLKRNNCHITLMDNATNARLFADNVIFPIEHFDTDTLDWSKAEGQLYYGAKYFPLRKDFFKHKRKKVVKKNRKNILVSFGGADPNNITLKVLKALKDLKIDKDISIKVLIGPAFQKKYRNKIYSLAKSFKNFKLINDAKNIIGVFQDIKFCFTALGVSIYELNHLNIPIILLYNYKSDKRCAEILEQRGIVKNIGYYREATRRSIKKAGSRFMETKICTKRYTDGKGAERVRKIITRDIYD